MRKQDTREPLVIALQEIIGLGPKAAEALVAGGLESKDKLARSTPGAIAARLKKQGVTISASRIEQDDWIGQAADQSLAEAGDAAGRAPASDRIVDLSDGDAIEFGHTCLTEAGDLLLSVELTPPHTGAWTLLLDGRHSESHRGVGTFKRAGTFEDDQSHGVEILIPVPPPGPYDIDAVLIVDGDHTTTEMHRRLTLTVAVQEDVPVPG